MNTHSHHFAGPSPSRGAKTRQMVSSACRCQEPRDRSVIAPATGASSAPACAPCRQDSGRDVSALLGQARHQGVHALPRHVPLGQPHRDEAVRVENRPFPIAFGGHGAVTVPRQEHSRL
jgi:hypothetical protein